MIVGKREDEHSHRMSQSFNQEMITLEDGGGDHKLRHHEEQDYASKESQMLRAGDHGETSMWSACQQSLQGCSDFFYDLIYGPGASRRRQRASTLHHHPSDPSTPVRHSYIQEENMRIMSEMSGAQGSRRMTMGAIWTWITNLEENEIKATRALGKGDSHFRPVQPNDYLRWRLRRAVAFYRERIPRYDKARLLMEALTTLGGAAMVVMSFLDISNATVLVAAGITTVTAWTEFESRDAKIGRYSSTIYALEELETWWNTRTSVVKSSTAMIDRLVETTESILLAEVQTWRSTSQVTKMMDKAMGEKGDGEDGKGGGGGNSGNSGSDNGHSHSHGNDDGVETDEDDFMME